VKTRIHRGRLRVRRALLDGLPSEPAAPPDHERRICLDLLQAKQEALDRHAPFAFSPGALCDRCRSIFAALDLGREVCRTMDSGDLPPSLRALIDEQRRPAPRKRTQPA
jgi:hypothetical protein